MDPALQLFKWELSQIFLDRGFIAKIIIGMGISLLLLPFLLNSLSSFATNVNTPNLPFVYKIITIGVVGEYPALVGILEGNTLLSVIHLDDEENARRLLANGELNGFLAVSGRSVKFVGNGNPLSSLAELQVREALDKVVKAGSNPDVKVIQEHSIEPFVKGIISPFIIFSPLLLWCLPIIQSISYDRENKMLEALFSLPIDRRKIFLAKVFANLAFAIFASFVWMLVLGAFGLNFVNFLGGLVMLSAISLLIISLNGLVSTISSNVKNATLASGIVSTIVFSFLFIISLLRINPYLAEFSSVSPVTYISYQVSGILTPFPLETLLLLLLAIISANLLSVAAFSTEKFAFSLNPGIAQLYEGMQELLGKPAYSAFAMGFVAFCLTLPVQVISLGILLFISSSYWIVIFLLAAMEESLKFIPLGVMKPSNWSEGALWGAIIGLSFGICESVLFAPHLEFIPLRAIPIAAHSLFTLIMGAGYGARRPYLGLSIAIILHFVYNETVLSRLI